MGAYEADSQSFYETNEQAGNEQEWNDLDAELGSSRGLRDGSWASSSNDFAASSRSDITASVDDNGVGFRVASVPDAVGLPVDGVVS